MTLLVSVNQYFVALGNSKVVQATIEFACLSLEYRKSILPTQDHVLSFAKYLILNLKTYDKDPKRLYCGRLASKPLQGDIIHVYKILIF